MKTSNYVPSLSYGSRVRFLGTNNHPKRGQSCTIIRILPNPSGKREHQWYDVKFDDDTLGRFLEKFLIAQADADNEKLVDDVA